MEVINAIGRRKSSIARVYVTEGTGKITINKKDLEVYFPSAILQYVVKQPLNLLVVVVSLARARHSVSLSHALW